MDTTGAIGFMCTGFVLFFALLFGFLALQRWLRHRENMAMIQQGMTPPPETKRRNGNGRTLLPWGIGIVTFGLIMMMALGALAMMVLSAGPTGPSISVSLPLLVLPGLAVLFMGGAVILVYVLLKPVKDQRIVPGTPMPPVPPTPQNTPHPPESPTVEFEAKVNE